MDCKIKIAIGRGLIRENTDAFLKGQRVILYIYELTKKPFAGRFDRKPQMKMKIKKINKTRMYVYIHKI